MNCPKCGLKIEDNQKFCPNCGIQINSKNHTNKWFYIIGGIVCIIVAVIFGVVSFNSQNKVVLALQPCDVLNNKFKNYEIDEHSTSEELDAYLVYIDKCTLPDLMKKQKIEEFNRQMIYLHSRLDYGFCSDEPEEESKKTIENTINRNPAYKDVPTALSRLYMWDIVDLFNQCANDGWQYSEIDEIISNADKINADDIKTLVDMLYESTNYGLNYDGAWCVDDYVDNLMKLTPYIIKDPTLKTKWINLFEKIKQNLSENTENGIVNPTIPTIENYVQQIVNNQNNDTKNTSYEEDSNKYVNSIYSQEEMKEAYAFANKVQNIFKNEDINTLADLIDYPIKILGGDISNKQEFIKLDTEMLFADVVKNNVCNSELSANGQGFMLGNGPNLWFGFIDGKLKIYAINL